MDWHHPVSARCLTDEAARAFVEYTQDLIRKLTTQDEKNDVIWYDMDWPLSAAQGKSEKMNQMVFQLQPDIIVNNRNGLLGDSQHRTGTPCRLDVPQGHIIIDSETATPVFRVLQETLTNVARHAAASAVEVRLVKEDGDLTLEVRDNGKGFPAEEPSSTKSLGILGMQERALLLGGELNISTVPGEGTTVQVRIPVAPHSERW